MYLRHRIASCCLCSPPIQGIIDHVNRGVAQPGSVLAWGASGRRFKSFRPDQSQSRARKQAGNLKPQNIFHGYTSGYTFQYSRDKHIGRISQIQ